MRRPSPIALLLLCAAIACTSPSKEDLIIGTWEVQPDALTAYGRDLERQAGLDERHTLIHFDADHRMRSETLHGEKRTINDTSTFALSEDGRSLDFFHADIPGGNMRASVVKLTADTFQFASPEGDTVRMTRYREVRE